MPDQPDTSPQSPPEKPLSRWSAVRFVVVFLVLTVFLLSAGRYAVNTDAMNWYLFQVARQTAFVLKLIGDEGYVETPDAYEGRAAVMRAEMDAWRRGEDAPAVPSDTKATPLTAYEIWLHRALRHANDLGTETKYFRKTDEIPPIQNPSTDDYLAHVRSLIERLNASATRGEGPMATYVAAPGVKEVAEEAKKSLAVLDNSAAKDSLPVGPMLAETVSNLEHARVAQRDFLDERIRKVTAQIQEKLGPQVTFVARKQENPPLQFTFSLVPDCGALPSMSIFIAALIAFPAPMRKRALGLLIGVPILYVINLARLTCLAAIGAYWKQNPEVFEFAHQYVWQAIYVLIVVGVWLLWVELIVKPGKTWRTNPSSAA
ncbi:MAG: exosortase/archaeosortase family protein [Candidatus Hydrogenedentes bacterium]|nr:exosortase/archaeosortase family protein [Candidatus Hydrogenedentota bacterium]